MNWIAGIGMVLVALLLMWAGCAAAHDNLFTAAQQAAQTRETRGLAASFLGFISMPLMMFASPHAAGGMVLREELRGYASTQLHVAPPLLKSNLQQVEFGWDVFRPWLNWPRWQAVELPEDEDELLKLDSLR